MEEYLTGYVFKITKLIQNIQLHFNEDTMERLPTVSFILCIWGEYFILCGCPQAEKRGCVCGMCIASSSGVTHLLLASSNHLKRLRTHAWFRKHVFVLHSGEALELHIICKDHLKITCIKRCCKQFLRNTMHKIPIYLTDITEIGFLRNQISLCDSTSLHKNYNFLIRTDLEKFSIKSLAHQRILCSEWVPSEWESKQMI